MTRTRITALVATLALAGVTASFAGAEFCWSETRGRGAGTIPASCGANQEKNGLLCYDRCPPGFTSNGIDLCIQNCPSGSSDDGLFCGWASYKAAEYPIWDEQRCRNEHGGACWTNNFVWVETCKQGYHHVAGFCEIDSIDCEQMGFAGKRVFNSCPKKVTRRDPVSPSCGSGMEMDAGLCYPSCGENASGAGPVCWIRGPQDWVQCGMGWAKDKAACDKAITDQVLSVVDAAASTALLVGTLGASTAANIAKEAAKKAGTQAAEFSVKQVFTKGAWKALKNVDKAAMKQAVKTMAVETGINTVITNASDAGRTAGGGSIDYIWEVGQLSEDDQMTDVEKAHAIAAITLNTASWLDPTGITGVIAAYDKPICNQIAAYNKKHEAGTVQKAAGTEALTTGSAAPEQAGASSGGWRDLGQVARDVGVGANGVVFYIAADGNANSAIYKLDGGRPVQLPGAAVRIAADGNGVPWVVNNTNAIFRWEGSNWRQLPGAAQDIGVGADGSAYVIGMDGNVYAWKPQIGNWQLFGGGGIRIAVDAQGHPWVVNAGTQIWRHDGTRWILLPGAAYDVGVDAAGLAWVIGTDHNLYRWDASVNNWQYVPGVKGINNVAGGAAGQVVVAPAPETKVAMLQMGGASGAGASVAGSGGMYEVMRSGVVDANLERRVTEGKKELDAANARVGQLQAAYDRTPADQRGPIQAQLDDARKRAASIKSDYDEAVSFRAKFLEAKQKWDAQFRSKPTV